MKIVTAEEMYKIDSFVINQIGISEEALMESAGQATVKYVIERLNFNQKIIVLAGAGNNGGDGFVIARMLKSLGYQIDLWVIPPYEKIKGAAKHALDVYIRSGYEFQSFLQNESQFFTLLTTYEVVIDCLLGIGVRGDLRSPHSEIINKLNTFKNSQVISIDVPSGVPADGGVVMNAVKADMTIVIHLPKNGAFTYPSASFYGEVKVVDIGIPPIAVNHCAEQKETWTYEQVKKHLPFRSPSSHRGTHGKGMIIGGSRQMPGAVMLSAKAALRSGAGLLTVAIPDDIHPIVSTHFLEAMYHPCTSEDGYFSGAISMDVDMLDAIAVGPGMGRTKGPQQLVENILLKGVPLILDADALYHLKDLLHYLKKRKFPTTLTPHSGELARLVNLSVEEVEQNRFSISKQFAEEYGVYLVLKGPFTIVTTPEGAQFVNTTGNSALAKGGSGDVLTGMILAFLMQHQHVQAAISNAVFVHGKAAELLVELDHTHMDVLATDIIDHIPQTLKALK